MRRDSRLSVALHVLLHMEEVGEAVTSDRLGPLLQTNPVVFRRTMAGLRDAGIVQSVKGHGGGWSVARGLDRVTLHDVYAALGLTSPFTIGQRDPNPTCLLEKAVNRSVRAALADAEALLVERLRHTTVRDVFVAAGPARKAALARHRSRHRRRRAAHGRV
jgi:DNA-binding IscR family transcriptional regulator